ncbi:hypothetical protein, partial [Micromonospora sp. MH33]|uniref:hypothetical protein n=1 Tax=Micromonospora sp. MH33 TaxID=1945509 RepID=UPI001AEF9016
LRPAVLAGAFPSGLSGTSSGARPGVGRRPSGRAARAAQDCVACAPHRSPRRSRWTSLRSPYAHRDGCPAA